MLKHRDREDPGHVHSHRESDEDSEREGESSDGTLSTQSEGWMKKLSSVWKSTTPEVGWRSNRTEPDLHAPRRRHRRGDGDGRKYASRGMGQQSMRPRRSARLPTPASAGRRVNSARSIGFSLQTSG